MQTNVNPTQNEKVEEEREFFFLFIIDLTTKRN